MAQHNLGCPATFIPIAKPCDQACGLDALRGVAERGANAIADLCGELNALREKAAKLEQERMLPKCDVVNLATGARCILLDHDGYVSHAQGRECPKLTENRALRQSKERLLVSAAALLDVLDRTCGATPVWLEQQEVLRAAVKEES